MNPASLSSYSPIPWIGSNKKERPVEENSSQCAYQLLIDLQISYLDRIRANEPPLPIVYSYSWLTAGGH